MVKLYVDARETPTKIPESLRSLGAEIEVANLEVGDYVYRLAIENGRARNQRNFRLRLTATDGAVWLRLFASELAFSRAGLHSIVPYSH